MCRVFLQAKQQVFSYRFDTRLWNRTELEGVIYFDNVAFSFQNISGLLGPSPEYDSHRRLEQSVKPTYVLLTISTQILVGILMKAMRIFLIGRGILS
jgi:hypothetical protein